MQGICPGTPLQPSGQHGAVATSAVDAEKQGTDTFISLALPCSSVVSSPRVPRSD